MAFLEGKQRQIRIEEKLQKMLAAKTDVHPSVAAGPAGLDQRTRSSCTRIHDYMLQTPTGKESGTAACLLDMVVEQLSNFI